MISLHSPSCERGFCNCLHDDEHLAEITEGLADARAGRDIPPWSSQEEIVIELERQLTAFNKAVEAKRLALATAKKAERAAKRSKRLAAKA